MKVFITISLFVIMINSSLKSQFSCDINSYKLFLSGDIHLSQSVFRNGVPMNNIIDKSLSTQLQIIKSIEDSIGLDAILLENPVCFEYFYNKYLETDDTLYLHFIQGNQYRLGKTYIYNELQNADNTLHIKCYDLLNDVDPNYIVDVLFLMTFYEPFVNSNPNTFVFNISNRYLFFKDIYETKFSRTDCFDQLKFIWDLKFNQPKYFSMRWLQRQMEINFNSVLSDRQDNLKLYFGSNYSYFVRLLRAYLAGCDIKSNDLQAREPLLYKNIIMCIDEIDSGTIYIDAGLMHVQQQMATPNLSAMLHDAKWQVYPIIYYYPIFEGMYTFEIANKVKSAILDQREFDLAPNTKIFLIN